MIRSMVLRGVSLGILVASLAGVTVPSLASTLVSQPPEPTSGPGGSDYSYATVTSRQFTQGATSYWLYEPDSPRPASAPVVVFLQGNGSICPACYQDWINHIVQKGNIVIFPIFLQGPGSFTSNALTEVQNALTELQNGNHVRPQLDQFALTGHSCGGVVAADLAALAATNGLPTPSVLMPTAPGCATAPQNYSQIPSSIRMAIMIPEFMDGFNGTPGSNAFAQYLWSQTPQIPLAYKDELIMRTDTHGTPDLVADHITAVTGVGGRHMDSLDYYGTWKVFDALTSCAWYGTYCDYALGGGANQVSMGTWSDGVAVRNMTETKTP